MKIRYNENMLEVGDHRLIRIDDWNVELQEENDKGEWEFVGYYGDLANAVRIMYTKQMNKIRRTLRASDPNHPYLDLYGDVEEIGGKLKASCSNKALGVDHLPPHKVQQD